MNRTKLVRVRLRELFTPLLVFPIPAIPKPAFRYSGLYNTGKYGQNFAGITAIRTYKMGTFDQNYYLLKNILSNIHLIYFGFNCKPAFIFIRNRLNPETLDALSFLRQYFIKNKST
jgi:hypothetical protein